MSARFIELPAQPGSNQGIAFDVPGPTVALPGYYMLWAVTDAGIPSEAVWVKVTE